jgi:REP element-mobilizing transposase RayT
MARPLRMTFPGAFYHITSRGNERKQIFQSLADRKKFLFYKANRYLTLLFSLTMVVQSEFSEISLRVTFSNRC